MMDKWADYLISAANYDSTRILNNVLVHKDEGGTISPPEEIDRTIISSNIKNGKSYITIFGSLSTWKKGHQVRTFRVGGNYYLRLDNNKVDFDNLGDLPTVQSQLATITGVEAPKQIPPPKPTPQPKRIPPPKPVLPPKPKPPAPKLETPAPNPKGGKEVCDIVNSTKEISNYAPIIHLESKLNLLNTKTNKSSDQFQPIRVQDIGSLARLTYDPDLPDEPNLALYLVPYKKKWVLGYLTSIELEDMIYCFNYVELEKEPNKPFVKYSGREGKQPEFSDTFQHGYPYLPIIKLKENHSIFGLE